MKSLYDSKFEAEMIKNLKSMEVQPPAGLWDDIESTLQARSKKRIIVITSWASAATIALLFTIGGMYIIDRKQSEVSLISKETVITSIKETKKTEEVKPIKENTNLGIQKKIESNIISNRSIDVQNQETIAVNIEDKVTGSESIPSTKTPIQAFIKSRKDNHHKRLHQLDFGQNEKLGNSIAFVQESPEKVKKGWIISASGFPVYSFHTSGAINKAGTKQEYGIISWGGSFSIRRSISRNLSLESGLIYNTMGQQERDVFLVFADISNTEVVSYPGLTNSYGLLNVPNVQLKVMDMRGLYALTTDAMNNSNFSKVNAIQQFRYLEIPILVVKRFSVKGISFHVKAGASAGFLIGNKLEISNSEINLKGETVGVDKFVYSSLASIGLSIPIYKNVSFNIEPSFRLGLGSLSTQSGKSYPFSTDIKFGFEVPIR